jgi:hypothetical protein
MAAFLIAEALLVTNAASFTTLLSFRGVVFTSVLAGVFPVLLLVASRRKGEHVPQTVVRQWGNPLFLSAVYVASLALVLAHGLVIWPDPLRRAGALAAGLLTLAMTVVMLWQGAFKRRLVVELRQDTETQDSASFAIMSAGRPVVSGVQLEYASGERRLETAAGDVAALSSLRRLSITPATNAGQAWPAGELKVRVHRVTADGDSEPLPALLNVEHVAATDRFDLSLTAGQVTVPLSGRLLGVEIELAPPSARAD